MLKEYRLEVAVIAGILAGIMFSQDNPFWIAGVLCAGINYVCYKKGI